MTFENKYLPPEAAPDFGFENWKIRRGMFTMHAHSLSNAARDASQDPETVRINELTDGELEAVRLFKMVGVSAYQV